LKPVKENGKHHGKDKDVIDIDWTEPLRTKKEIKRCVKPGQTFRFTWKKGHNVVIVNKFEYKDCKYVKKNNPLVSTKAKTGPSRLFYFGVPGTHYFIDGVGNNCSKFKIKAKITVKKDCKKRKTRQRKLN